MVKYWEIKLQIMCLPIVSKMQSDNDAISIFFYWIIYIIKQLQQSFFKNLFMKRSTNSFFKIHFVIFFIAMYNFSCQKENLQPGSNGGKQYNNYYDEIHSGRKI